MKEFIFENIGIKPVAVLAGVLLMYFVYTEADKRAIAQECRDTISKKDEVIMSQNIREQKLNDQLLMYALQLARKETDEKETDSLLRKKTENNVKNILNHQ